MFPHRFKVGLATCAIAVAMLAGAADAAHLSFRNFDNNDCTGKNAPNGGDTGFVTGNGLFDCTYDGSPVIARFNFDGNLNVTKTEINPFFASVNGGEFSFERVEGLSDGNAGTTFGYKFTYTPGAGDPAITAFAAKGGPGFNLYDGYDGQPTFTTATFLTPLNNGGQRSGLSHITFFDTAAVIPLPAAGLLLFTALGGIGVMRRRRKA